MYSKITCVGSFALDATQVAGCHCKQKEYGLQNHCYCKSNDDTCGFSGLLAANLCIDGLRVACVFIKSECYVILNAVVIIHPGFKFLVAV